ncbi:MAG TPA: hypothetical protein VEU08_06765, partial [Vicinamibacterales bacterium]|nr:hypothetical protein [Vicinamibacterales bacterium]
GIRRLFVADTVEDDDVTRALSAGAEMVLERSAAVASLSDALHQVLARPHPRRADAKAALSGARLLVRAHQRFRTNKPPLAPPPLRCPSCDVTLVYDHSHVGGVSARFEEQWDYFVCEKCGSFEFRQRTRNLRRTVMLS